MTFKVFLITEYIWNIIMQAYQEIYNMVNFAGNVSRD